MIHIVEEDRKVTSETIQYINKITERTNALTQSWGWLCGALSTIAPDNDSNWQLRYRVMPSVGSFLKHYGTMYETLAALYARGDLPPDQLNAIRDVLTQTVTDMTGQELE